MNVLELTYDQTVEWAKEIVESKPAGFRYQDAFGEYCQYAVPSSGEKGYRPACLVGCILDKADFDMTRFIKGEKVVGLYMNAVSIRTLFDKGILKADYRTQSFLQSLQDGQDSGHSWQDALKVVEMDTL